MAQTQQEAGSMLEQLGIKNRTTQAPGGTTQKPHSEHNTSMLDQLGIKQPFRFSDLPPELRNRIMGFATSKPEPLRLRELEPPAITRVSRQIRHESIPVFFDANDFIAELAAPYSFYGGYNWALGGYTRGRFLPETDSRWKQTCRLQIPQDIHTFFRDAGKLAARMKNLEYRIYSVRTVHARNSPNHYGFMLRLTLGTQPTVRFEGRDSIANSAQQHFDEDCEYLTEEAVKLMRSYTAKAGYCGMSIAEIRKVAQSFRQVPRDGAPHLSKIARSW